MDGWIIAALVVWALMTCVGMYVLSFWFNENLLRLGWTGATFIMFVLLGVVGVGDTLMLSWDFLEPEPATLVALVHCLVLIMIGVGYEVIQAWIGWPYRR